MEILVSDDNLLYHRNGPFPKGTIIYTSKELVITPIWDVSVKQIDMARFNPTKWILEQDSFSLCLLGETFWRNRGYGPPLHDKGVEGLRLSKDEQEFVIRHRPHFIGQILKLDPELKSKYQHELELSRVDL
jgi:hypothetical protein